MPISDMGAVPAIAAEINRLQPVRVLDLGVGFGKYGAIIREIVDAQYGRCRPDQWHRRIDGAEGHEEYRNPLWDLYDNVWIGDFTARPWTDYHLVLMVDSLEHLEPEAGRDFLSLLLRHNERVIVSVPLGPMVQDAAFGNEFERHRTTFSGREFDRYKAKQLYRGMCLAVSIERRG